MGIRRSHDHQSWLVEYIDASLEAQITQQRLFGDEEWLEAKTQPISPVFKALSSTIALDSLRLSSAPEPTSTLVADGKTNNQRLKDALLACLEAEAKIPEEQEKLRKLLRTVPFEGVEYRLIEYQIDLVAAQLTRAAEIAEARLSPTGDKIRTPADEAREKAICESDTKHFIRWWGGRSSLARTRRSR